MFSGALLVNEPKYIHRVQSETREKRVNARLMSTEETAEFLGRTARAVRAMVQRHQIPYTRIGRRLHFDPVALDKWIRKNTCDATQS